MVDRAVKFDFRAVGDATVRSPTIRAEITRLAEAARDRTAALTGDEIVTQHAGKKRARSYVTRLGSGAAGEARDGALQRGLGR